MITARQLTLRRGTKVVLQACDFILNPGERASLVGRNGVGKSSLFSLMAGRLQADAGDLNFPARWRMAEVAQAMPETTDSATDFVLQGDSPLQAAQDALAQAEASNDGHAIGDAHVALDEAGAFDAPARAQALLLGLGFKPGELDAPVKQFSGGWRMRLQLARALMSPSDLLLLDEPTNHLDLDALVWLEAWLQRYAGTMLIISHDREFLDAVTSVTLHMDEAKVTRYGGNYTAFESMRAERMSQAQAAFGKQQERMAHLQRFIDRFKAKASKAKQAQSRVKALARMEKLAPVLTASDFAFEFRELQSLPNPMLVLDKVSAGYGSNVIVQNVNRTVLAGQRIGILGANGQGKSTLVKTIAQVLKPLGGALTEGKGLSIGYFAQQEMDLLHEDDTPLQRMVRLAREVSPNAREQELRNFLGQFRFVDAMVHQAVSTLSGGERARLVLATIVWQRPNLLLFDEPTNHLDLNTREALSIALNEFEGTVLLVSHDRALLREVCDEFWLVTRGGIHNFEGDLDDYQRWLLDYSRAVARGAEPPPLPSLLPPAAPSVADMAPASSKKAAGASAGRVQPTAQANTANAKDERRSKAQARAKQADATRPLRAELTHIDKRLAALALEKTSLQTNLSSGRLNAEQMAEHGRNLHHIAAETGMLEERWLALSEELEASQTADRAA